MRRVDLRRDTITLPDEKMKKLAFKADLGDSVYGEDPAQNQLEALAAEKMGKERAIFVPSGTMGNLVALLSHTNHGDEIILEENAHIRLSETGGAAFVGGLMIKTVPGIEGAPDPQQVEKAIRKDNIHYPRTGLISVESTHYRYGGIVPPLELMKKIYSIGQKYGIPVHLDGARIFNSALYLGVEAKEIARYADSVMFCVSKGLGAPVGSLLCGSKNFISKAVRFRKMLGGGMRQTGWLCTCGILALEDENIKRLSEDHKNALLLAEGLSSLPGIKIDLKKVQTNFVLAHFDNTDKVPFFIKFLEQNGVLVTQADINTVRFVTSKQVNKSDIEYVLKIANHASKEFFLKTSLLRAIPIKERNYGNIF